MRASAGVSADLRSPARSCVGVCAQEHTEDMRGGDEFSCGDAPASGVFSHVSPGFVLLAILTSLRAAVGAFRQENQGSLDAGGPNLHILPSEKKLGYRVVTLMQSAQQHH